MVLSGVLSRSSGSVKYLASGSVTEEPAFQGDGVGAWTVSPQNRGLVLCVFSLKVFRDSWWYFLGVLKAEENEVYEVGFEA